MITYDGTSTNNISLNITGYWFLLINIINLLIIFINFLFFMLGFDSGYSQIFNYFKSYPSTWIP